jgi:hypothetical protein
MVYTPFVRTVSLSGEKLHISDRCAVERVDGKENQMKSYATTGDVDECSRGKKFCDRKSQRYARDRPGMQAHQLGTTGEVVEF